MKKLSVLFALCALFSSFTALAHGGGHGHGAIEPSKAIQVAQSAAKLMTFKDHGMQAGKLDESWNRVPTSSYIIVEENKQGFIVKAENSETKKSLYFQVTNQGYLKQASFSRAFEKDHGHSH